jgi:crotonobetaine/carnitine-CoA ligase
MHTLSELVQARAQDSRDRVFAFFQGRSTTYGQVHVAVEELAGVLVQAGVKSGDRVGLMLGQSVEHMEMCMAIAWVGAVMVPFSIHLKSAGIELQLSSARPSLMVASRAFADAIRAARYAVAQPPELLWFEDGADLQGEFHLDALLGASRAVSDPVLREPADAITIMYTSGTTGAPKGAVGSEQSWWTGAKTTGIITDAQQDDVFHFWEPLYHGSAWIVMALAMQKGLKLHMVDRFSASRLWDQVGEGGATKLHYLGGLVNILLSQPPHPAERDNNVSIAWGAACPTDSWRRFEERFGLQVREGYGLTEGGMFTHLNLDGKVGSMGKPVEEYDSWVVDEKGQRLAVGEVGELVLKPRVPFVQMTEYWGEPEKTKEVLRDGCVYTGDLAMVDRDGDYYFKGRKKDALRRRGENISAWEVERVINAAPGVEECAVIGVDSAMGEQEVMAFVKMCVGEPGDALALMKFCAERLAYYQVPRYWQFVEDFPRGPTQRIVKREIKADLGEAWDAEKAGVKPARAS